MKKRYISLLSAVCLSLFPFSTAYAEGDGGLDPIYEAVKQFGSETDYLTYVNYGSLVKAEKESNKAYADFLDRCSDSELFEEPAKKYTDTMFAGRCLGISLLEIMAHNGLIRPSDIQEGAVNMTDIELDDTARYYTDYYQSVQLHRDFDLYFKWYMSRYGRAERVEKLLETAEKAAEDKKYFLIMIRSGNFMHAVAGIGVLEGDWEFEGKHYDKCIPTFDSNVVKQQYIPEKMVCWGFNRHSSLYVNTDTLEIYSPNYSEYLGGEFEVFSSDDEALLYSKSLFPADTDTGSLSDELCEIDIDSSSACSINALRADGSSYTADKADYPTFAAAKGTAYYLDGERFRVDTEESGELYVRYADLRKTVISKTSGSVSSITNSPGGTEIDGEDFGYDMMLLLNEGSYTFAPHYRWNIRGEAKEKIQVTQGEKGMILGGDSGVKCTLSVYDSVFDDKIKDKEIASKVNVFAAKSVMAVCDDKTGEIRFLTGEDYTLPVEAGDVNCDERLNASDASYVLADYAETAVGREAFLNRQLADYNGDGYVNAVDASQILAAYADNSVS